MKTTLKYAIVALAVLAAVILCWRFFAGSDPAPSPKPESVDTGAEGQARVERRVRQLLPKNYHGTKLRIFLPVIDGPLPSEVRIYRKTDYRGCYYALGDANVLELGYGEKPDPEWYRLLGAGIPYGIRYGDWVSQFTIPKDVDFSKDYEVKPVFRKKRRNPPGGSGMWDGRVDLRGAERFAGKALLLADESGRIAGAVEKIPTKGAALVNTNGKRIVEAAVYELQPGVKIQVFHCAVGNYRDHRIDLSRSKNDLSGKPKELLVGDDLKGTSINLLAYKNPGDSLPVAVVEFPRFPEEKIVVPHGYEYGLLEYDMPYRRTKRRKLAGPAVKLSDFKGQ